MGIWSGCAKAGVTTGEWGETLRKIFGEFRAPTGISGGQTAPPSEPLQKARAAVARFEKETGERLRILVGKPGLDGHSNGAEQIAVRARNAGMEVIYQGIRLTPLQIVESALQEGVHVIGLSILSGSHVELTGELFKLMRAKKMADVPVVAGGIIPSADEKRLKKLGVAKIYTPKDFDLNAIVGEIAGVALAARQKRMKKGDIHGKRTLRTR